MQSLIFALKQSVVSRLSGFARDKHGVSAVEFALILPLMLLLYFGMVEVSQGIIVDRKVKMTARTVADLISQVSKTDNSGIDAALGASTAILAPFATANAKVIVSGVSIDNNGNAKVVWSRANKDAGHGTGDSVTVPEALKTPNSFLVWGEATYDYAPALGYVTGPMKLSNQIFMRPRLSKTVSCCS
jgi:Flp pilus assembly protein TadG